MFCVFLVIKKLSLLIATYNTATADVCYINCSWGDNSWISALSSNAWNYSYHSIYACPFNGRRRCKECFEKKVLIHVYNFCWLKCFCNVVDEQVEKAEVINNLLFVSGINTLSQTLFGTRLPVVMRGSYSFIIPAVSIVTSNRFKQYTDPHQVGLPFSSALL